MAEVKDLEELKQEEAAPAMEEIPADSAAPAPAGLKARWQAIPRKTRRRFIRLGILILALLVIAAVLLKVLGGRGGGESQVVTDVVQYGSITSTVQGSGLTKAKSSETLTLTTAGTVLDVLVSEGETVTAGTPLFTIDSPAAELLGNFHRRGGLAGAGGAGEQHNGAVFQIGKSVVNPRGVIIVQIIQHLVFRRIIRSPF